MAASQHRQARLLRFFHHRALVLPPRLSSAVVSGRNRRDHRPRPEPSLPEAWAAALGAERQRRRHDSRRDHPGTYPPRHPSSDHAAIQPVSKRQAGGILGTGRRPADGHVRGGGGSHLGHAQRGDPSLGRVRPQPQDPLRDRRSPDHALPRRTRCDAAVPRQPLRLAFTRTDHRMQRKSDGTVVIEGRRFEIPNRYRHLTRLEVRYAGWDLGLVHLVDERTGTVLTRLYPQDKTQNASGLRRTLSSVASATPMPTDVEPATGLPPLLARMLDQQAATGLPPAYLPKDEAKDEEGETP